MKEKTEGFRVYIFKDNIWKPTHWDGTDSFKTHDAPVFLTRAKAREGLKEAKKNYPELKYAIFYGVKDEPRTP